MKQSFFNIFLATISVVLLSAIVTVNAADDNQVELVQSELERDFCVNVSHEKMRNVVDGNIEFAFDLYHQLKKDDGNVVFSPYCLSHVLAMTWAGTRGLTKDEMGDTLHFVDPPDVTHRSFNLIELLITNHSDIIVETANLIWGQENEYWKPDFLDTIKTNYGTGIYNLDFINSPEQSRKIINEWVEENTSGKFRELLNPGEINSYTRMVLVNTLYFSGQWVNMFKDGTKDEDFTLLDETTVKVPMMNEKDLFAYMLGDNYNAVVMGYGPEMARFVNARMIVILPDIGKFREIESGINREFLDNIMRNLSWGDVHLKFPRFDFKKQYDLTGTLESMGMKSAFYDADFSGMSGRDDLFISSIVQNAFIKVDEERTEAGAAADVVVCSGVRMVDEVLEFFVNHPFIFIIEEHTTGTILFMGRVLDPRER